MAKTCNECGTTTTPHWRHPHGNCDSPEWQCTKCWARIRRENKNRNVTKVTKKAKTKKVAKKKVKTTKGKGAAGRFSRSQLFTYNGTC